MCKGGGKLVNATTEMRRLEINILCLSDIQQTGKGKIKTDNGTMYFSGNHEAAHRKGVIIIVEKKIEKSLTNFIPYLIWIKFQRQLKTRHNNNNMGTFKVCKERVERCTGCFGLGKRNERGDRLIEFSQNEKQTQTLYMESTVVQKAQFAQKQNRLDRYIKQRYGNTVTSAKTYTIMSTSDRITIQGYQ